MEHYWSVPFLEKKWKTPSSHISSTPLSLMVINSVPPSVCLSVTLVSHVKTVQNMFCAIQQFLGAKFCHRRFRGGVFTLNEVRQSDNLPNIAR